MRARHDIQRGGAAGARTRVHREPRGLGRPARVRGTGGRARRETVGRPAAAHRDRAGHTQGTRRSWCWTRRPRRWTAEVEAAIQEQLDELMQNRTVIAIAHRLSTIARMDKLAVARRGTHRRAGHARGAAGAGRAVCVAMGAAVGRVSAGGGVGLRFFFRLEPRRSRKPRLQTDRSSLVLSFKKEHHAK